MADRFRDRQYYEVTKEKPAGWFQLLMVGGSAGSVLAFLTISMLGSYIGMSMDGLALAFLVSGFLGFFFGVLLTWFVLTYFGKIVNIPDFFNAGIARVGEKKMEEKSSGVELSPVIEDETMGKSVDFVFPELSPDKQ
jgi:hypothetical protein